MTPPAHPAQRSLLLNGFMGSGKTRLGELVAARLGLPFLDLDQELERQHQRSVRELFASLGEAGFRQLERQRLTELLGDSELRVLALGGGALLERSTRLRALEQGVVVSLSAPVETLLERLSGDTTRPLLDGAEPAERVRALLDSRALAYAEAHAVIDTSQLALEQLARRVAQIWLRQPIAVAAAADSYRVEICNGELSTLLAELLASGELGKAPTRLLWVSDTNVERHHGALRQRVEDAASRDAGARPDSDRAGAQAALPPHSAVLLTPGEEHKSLDALPAIYQHCLEHGVDRQSVVIGLGGGVVTDIAGFAAATWMRGVRWIGLPSTLLAMVDASVGGKTAVDFGPAKNCVGAFWQPSAVVCDVELLKTEPQRGYVSALSEVIKTALIGDPQLLDVLEQQSDLVLARDSQLLMQVVRRCVAVKAGIVSRDPREAAERVHLNLGHTLGHAMEAYAGYGALTHGEAISLGLIAALRLGCRLGHTPRALAVRVEALLTRLGLPIDLERHHLPAACALLGHDKKRRGAVVRFVFCRAAGDVFSTYIALADLQRQAADLQRA